MMAVTVGVGAWLLWGYVTNFVYQTSIDIPGMEISKDASRMMLTFATAVLAWVKMG